MECMIKIKHTSSLFRGMWSKLINFKHSLYYVTTNTIPLLYH